MGRAHPTFSCQRCAFSHGRLDSFHFRAVQVARNLNAEHRSRRFVHKIGVNRQPRVPAAPNGWRATGATPAAAERSHHSPSDEALRSLTSPLS